MKRRDFIIAAGGTGLAWPLTAHAQQKALPVVGFLNSASPDVIGDRLRAFRQGLTESGYVEGENVVIDYRWAENRMDRLPELTAQLIRERVAVIAAAGGPGPAQIAKSATKTVPIVFIAGHDPVELGLVASLARPGGNVTGINFFAAELVAKRLELLREMLPQASRIAVLINPAGIENRTALAEIESATHTIGFQVRFLNASTNLEIDAAFETFASERPDALFIVGDPYFTSRRVQLVQLAAHHRMPTSYSGRQFPEVGGLMSYGASLSDAYRQLGVYSGRILKGAKPADLPVLQSTKFDLIINHQTARMIGLTVPQTMLTAADEVIE